MYVVHSSKCTVQFIGIGYNSVCLHSGTEVFSLTVEAASWMFQPLCIGCVDQLVECLLLAVSTVTHVRDVWAFMDSCMS